MAYDFTDKCKAAFRKLRAALMSEPVLILPQTGPTARFVISTDSSRFAISAVLLKDQGRGLQHLEYYARSMIVAEQKYPTHEQELLAVVEALRHWRCYLEGCDIAF